MIQPASIWRPANQQAVYRGLLRAMSRPGQVIELGELLDDAPAFLAVLAALVDQQVTVHDACGRLEAGARRMLACRLATAERADFILCDGSQPPAVEFQPKLGSVYRPDASATLVLAVSRVGAGNLRLELSGPGIPAAEQLSVAGLALPWLVQRARWVARYPLGVDIFLCDPQRVAALPRTTQVGWTSNGG